MYLMQSSTASVLCESTADTGSGFEVATGMAGTGCCSWWGLLFMAIKCQARVTLLARCFKKLSGENCRPFSDLNLNFLNDPVLRLVALLDMFLFSILCSIVAVVIELEGRSEEHREKNREIKKRDVHTAEKCRLPTKACS